VEIDEIAARLLRQYWALILLCVLAPLVAITLMVAKQPPMYAASARIVSGSTVPASNAQAQALVSQIQGVATGKTTAASALKNAHVTRDVNNFITSHVSVAGLGGSQVVDLTVTDRNPRAAATLAKELAEEVVQQINRTGQSGLSTTLNAIDQEIVRLSEQHGVVATQAAANPKNEQLQSKLAGLNQVIANFSGDRSRLLIQASTQGLASVLDQPVVPEQPQSKALAQKLGLAAVLGLVVGILIAAIAETIRPTVPGARRVSRRLGAPTLGQLKRTEMHGEQTPNLENLAMRLRMAANHAEVSTIALIDVNAKYELADLAHGLELNLRPPDESLAAHADSNGRDGDGDGDETMAFGSVMVKGRQLISGHQTLHVYPMSQIKHLGTMSNVGLVVLSGPVSRVSRVMALDDLVTSSGWPILGVVGVPRVRRGLLGRLVK
jgi:capsular polysaccharide biosynthesis protein